MDVESDVNKNENDTTIENNNEKKNMITNIRENDKSDKNEKNDRNNKYDKNEKKYSGGIIVFDTSIQITLAPTPSLSSLPYSPLPSSVALMGVRR